MARVAGCLLVFSASFFINALVAPVRLEQLSTSDSQVDKNSPLAIESLANSKTLQPQPQQRFHLSVDPFIMGSAYRYHHPKQLERAFDLTSPHSSPNSLLNLKYKSQLEKEDDSSLGSSLYNGDDLFLRWLVNSKDEDAPFAARSDSGEFEDRLPYSSPAITMAAANTFGEVPSYISNDWAQVGPELSTPWRLLGLPRYSLDESMKIKRGQQ